MTTHSMHVNDHEGDWENTFLSFIFTVYGKKLRGMRAGHAAADQHDHNYWTIA